MIKHIHLLCLSKKKKCIHLQNKVAFVTFIIMYNIHRCVK